MRSFVCSSSPLAVIAALSLVGGLALGCSSAAENGGASASADSVEIASAATTLVAGVAGAQLQGVTDDGMVVYLAGTRASMVPLAGGAPVSLGSGAFFDSRVVVAHTT